jgi:hypothetical protein
MHPAQSSRIAKEKNPENWCAHPKCLWNTRRSGPCPKHGTDKQGNTLAEQLAAGNAWSGIAGAQKERGE